MFAEVKNVISGIFIATINVAVCFLVLLKINFMI